MIVGTAGHIDHGKTMLVKALTGVETDRLKEEKARGITIELGFAYHEFAPGRVTGFVDVPGHERFVHTMLAGAGGIDFALLVVAADDGVMPQTREHLAILDLLGVSRGIVALTKVDMVEPARRAEVEADIRDLLAPTGLRRADILPVSAVTGEGIETLRARLAEAETQTVEAALDRRFRLAVDRCFTLSGAGTVVTGTVLSGVVAVGDTLLVSPSGLSARLRSLHAQNRPASRGVAGERCALNLAGEGVSKEAIARGDMVVDPALHAPTDRIDARLSVLAGEPKPLGSWFPARLHHGGVEAGVRLVPLGDPLSPGTEGLVQLVLDRPIAAAVGDRFILRDVSASRTLGGGRFLDLRPPARKRKGPERLARLAAEALTEPAEALAGLLQTPPGFVDLAAFARDRALMQEAVRRALAESGAVTLAAGAASFAFSPAALDDLRARMAALLEGFHAENPELQGMGRERLRLQVAPRLPAPAFLALLRAEAEAERLALDGAFVRLPGHAVRLSEQEDALYARLLPHLEGEGRFRPPRVRDFAEMLGEDEREVRRVLKLCSRLGRVDQIRHDHFFTRATTAEMVAIVRAIAAESGEFPAGAFRDRVNSGRKVAIEILEFFDRHGITLRRGDLRRFNPHRGDLFGGG